MLIFPKFKEFDYVKYVGGYKSDHKCFIYYYFIQYLLNAYYTVP